jgi:hypothetical protein
LQCQGGGNPHNTSADDRYVIPMRLFHGRKNSIMVPEKQVGCLFFVAFDPEHHGNSIPG